MNKFAEDVNRRVMEKLAATPLLNRVVPEEAWNFLKNRKLMIFGRDGDLLRAAARERKIPAAYTMASTNAGGNAPGMVAQDFNAAGWDPEDALMLDTGFKGTLMRGIKGTDGIQSPGALLARKQESAHFPSLAEMTDYAKQPDDSKLPQFVRDMLVSPATPPDHIGRRMANWKSALPVPILGRRGPEQAIEYFRGMGGLQSDLVNAHGLSLPSDPNGLGVLKSVPNGKNGKRLSGPVVKMEAVPKLTGSVGFYSPEGIGGFNPTEISMKGEGARNTLDELMAQTKKNLNYRRNVFQGHGLPAEWSEVSGIFPHERLPDYHPSQEASSQRLDNLFEQIRENFRRIVGK
jgi:hypothetical protein